MEENKLINDLTVNNVDNEGMILGVGTGDLQIGTPIILRFNYIVSRSYTADEWRDIYEDPDQHGAEYISDGGEISINDLPTSFLSNSRGKYALVFEYTKLTDAVYVNYPAFCFMSSADLTPYVNSDGSPKYFDNTMYIYQGETFEVGGQRNGVYGIFIDKALRDFIENEVALAGGIEKEVDIRVSQYSISSDDRIYSTISWLGVQECPCNIKLQYGSRIAITGIGPAINSPLSRYEPWIYASVGSSVMSSVYSFAEVPAIKAYTSSLTTVDDSIIFDLFNTTKIADSSTSEPLYSLVPLPHIGDNILKIGVTSPTLYYSRNAGTIKFKLTGNGVDYHGYNAPTTLFWTTPLIHLSTCEYVIDSLDDQVDLDGQGEIITVDPTKDIGLQSINSYLDCATKKINNTTGLLDAHDWNNHLRAKGLPTQSGYNPFSEVTIVEHAEVGSYEINYSFGHDSYLLPVLWNQEVGKIEIFGADSISSTPYNNYQIAHYSVFVKPDESIRDDLFELKDTDSGETSGAYHEDMTLKLDLGDLYIPSVPDNATYSYKYKLYIVAKPGSDIQHADVHFSNGLKEIEISDYDYAIDPPVVYVTAETNIVTNEYFTISMCITEMHTQFYASDGGYHSIEEVYNPNRDGSNTYGVFELTVEPGKYESIDIKLNEQSVKGETITYNVGQTFRLVADVDPDTTGDYIEWSVSDDNIEITSISSDKKTADFEMISSGRCTITAAAHSNLDVSASVDVVIADAVYFNPSSKEVDWSTTETDASTNLISNMSWTAAITDSSVDWAALTGTTSGGVTSGTPVMYTVSKVNYTDPSNQSPRSFVIQIAEYPNAKFTYTQRGWIPYFNAIGTIRELIAAGDSLSLTIRCNYGWSVSSSQSWVTVNHTTGGNNADGYNSDTEITISADVNTDTAKRTATLTFTCPVYTEYVNDQNITITQNGAEPSIALDTENLEFGALSGYSARVKVISMFGGWKVSSNTGADSNLNVSPTTGILDSGESVVSTDVDIVWEQWINANEDRTADITFVNTEHTEYTKTLHVVQKRANVYFLVNQAADVNTWKNLIQNSTEINPQIVVSNPISANGGTYVTHVFCAPGTENALQFNVNITSNYATRTDITVPDGLITYSVIKDLEISISGSTYRVYKLTVKMNKNYITDSINHLVTIQSALVPTVNSTISLTQNSAVYTADFTVDSTDVLRNREIPVYGETFAINIENKNAYDNLIITSVTFDTSTGLNEPEDNIDQSYRVLTTIPFTIGKSEVEGTPTPGSVEVEIYKYSRPDYSEGSSTPDRDIKKFRLIVTAKTSSNSEVVTKNSGNNIAVQRSYNIGDRKTFETIIENGHQDIPDVSTNQAISSKELENKPYVIYSTDTGDFVNLVSYEEYMTEIANYQSVHSSASALEVEQEISKQYIIKGQLLDSRYDYKPEN